MATEANIDRLGDNIVNDMMTLAGHNVGPSGASWQDIAGTLALNLRVFADALEEQRFGRLDFVGWNTPVEVISTMLDGITGYLSPDC